MDNQRRKHPSVLLRPLDVSDEKQATQAHEELARDDFEFLFVRQGEAWPDYLERVERERLGVDLREGWVPSTFLMAEVEGQIVGRVSIRHELNTYLAQFGGHIGYGVRPGFRRRGYATDILRQSLAVAASIGLDRVLVTCDVDNVGSAGTIERCGGVLENVVLVEGSVPRRRYWVETGS
ncbi:MAG: GNAT family N-acetyltransferase [Actinomycetota bacterium]